MKNNKKNLTEEIQVVFENDKIKIERIYSHGVSSATDFWYDSDIDEWVSVQKGSAVIEFGGDNYSGLVADDNCNNSANAHVLKTTKTLLCSGDNCYIKAHTRHRVDSTTADCEWLCVYIK